MITTEFAVAPFVTVIPGEVGSTVAAETVIVVMSPVVLTADRLPVVETPVVMAAETPDMTGMVIKIPVLVVGGTEKMVVVVPPGAPLRVPAVPLLGLATWARLGN